MVPKVADTLLRDNFATYAANCDVTSGKLEPHKAFGFTLQHLESNTESVHFSESGGQWLQWPGDVDVVRGPLANDTMGRLYFTGDGPPKYTTALLATQGQGPYPTVTRTLGLPVPSTISVTAPAGSPAPGVQKIATAYVRTFVSDLGEEGPPSLPSNIVDRWDGGAVALSNMQAASGSFVLVSQRIYRVELNGVYQFVAELPIANSTFNDLVDTEQLGEAVPSSEWVAPHPDMRGLTALPGGILAGFWLNTLAFSEPYQPHAWPERYRLALDNDVVAIAVSAQGLVVATKGAPYLVTGNTPESMVPMKMEIAAACVSKRSMVDMGPFVVWAGSEGLFAGGGADAQNITADFITPEQWMAQYNPSQLRAVRWGERYLGFYKNSSLMWSFSPEEGFIHYGENATSYTVGAHRVEPLGRIYMIREEGDQIRGRRIATWRLGVELGYLWRSKTYNLPPGQTLGVGRIDADGYPIQCGVYLDGQLRKQITVTNNKAFRLPTGARYRKIAIELAGTGSVYTVQLASSMSELAP